METVDSPLNSHVHLELQALNRRIHELQKGSNSHQLQSHLGGLLAIIQQQDKVRQNQKSLLIKMQSLEKQLIAAKSRQEELSRANQILKTKSAQDAKKINALQTKLTFTVPKRDYDLSERRLKSIQQTYSQLQYHSALKDREISELQQYIKTLRQKNLMKPQARQRDRRGVTPVLNKLSPGRACSPSRKQNRYFDSKKQFS